MKAFVQITTATMFFLSVAYLQGCAPLEVGIDAKEQNQGRLVFKSM